MTPLHTNVEHLRLIRAAPCPVCGCNAPYFDTVDFNKSCEEARGVVFPPCGIPIAYNLCNECGFCFAPEFRSWSFYDFEQLIYNADYALVDPDYQFIRPTGNANFVAQTFGSQVRHIRHLDYGGGSGLLSTTLRNAGWASESYDPFVDQGTNPESLGSFDLVTAFEVFEHVPDVVRLFDTLQKLCKPKGLILFSTLLSDGNIDRSQKCSWWYASPRNGHISLFSQKSLWLLASQRGMKLASFSQNLHAVFTELPDWASHVIKIA